MNAHLGIGIELLGEISSRIPLVSLGLTKFCLNLYKTTYARMILMLSINLLINGYQLIKIETTLRPQKVIEKFRSKTEKRHHTSSSEPILATWSATFFYYLLCIIFNWNWRLNIFRQWNYGQFLCTFSLRHETNKSTPTVKLP